MQFEFQHSLPSSELLVNAGSALVRVVCVRNPRARRYVLRFRPDGTARLTLPPGGSLAEGRRFAEKHTDWLRRQIERLSANPVEETGWAVGSEIWLQGERVPITYGLPEDEPGTIRFGTERLRVDDPGQNLRPAIERHLWELAWRELPPIVFEHAVDLDLCLGRVTVRNQRSRWGSCSHSGTISLNWRLIQTPEFVRHYIVIHELCHLVEMNHSSRFWAEVAEACPDYPVAEAWLKRHSSLLR